ncbi:MAG: hypothetical protein QGF09_00865 [Rhodospirillales bacterium]|nr:hypothetical protein [Rhodospirillales bacterium]
MDVIDHFNRLFRIRHDQAFRDLYLQLLRSYARFVHAILNDVDQIGLTQLADGQIDRHADI